MHTLYLHDEFNCQYSIVQSHFLLSQVPTTFAEMFLFNAAVMGFSNSGLTEESSWCWIGSGVL